MSSVLPKNMFRLINILILVTGIHAVCKRQKTISSGVLSGEYYLKEENSKYCGDGCLYSRQDDPLSHHNQPFGYCMEFTDDCSCTGHCGPLPGLNDGKFTKCKDANGVLVNISPLTEPEEIKYPEGTRCTLDCSREQSQTRTLLIGPALNSRFYEVVCDSNKWRDIFFNPLPENINDICKWEDEMCHPPWTWSPIRNGRFECDNVIETDKPVGILPGQTCTIKCENPTIDNEIKELAESTIICRKIRGKGLGWQTKNGKILLLEHIQNICVKGCEGPHPVENGNYKNCTVQGEPILLSDGVYPENTICYLECDHPLGPTSLFSSPSDHVLMYITCETYKWVDRQGRAVPTISQSCPPPPTGVFPSVKKCPPLKTELLKGGSYKCMFQGQEIKEMLQYPEYPAGSSCTLECEPGLFERPMFAGNKIYCIEEFDGTKWRDLKGEEFDWSKINNACPPSFCPTPPPLIESEVQWKCTKSKEGIFTANDTCIFDCQPSDLNETESTLASTPTTIVQSTITLESTQTTASIRTTPSRSTTGRTTTSRTTTRRTTTGRSTTRSTTTSQTTTRRTTTGRTTTSRTTTRRTTSTTSETTSTKRTTRTTRSTTERPQSSDVPNLKHIASLLGNQGIFGVDGPINSLDSPINRLDRPINRLDIPINRLNMESFYPTNDEINFNLLELKNDHGTPHNGPVIVSESYTIICTQKGWVEKTGNQVALIDIYDLKLKCLEKFNVTMKISSTIGEPVNNVKMTRIKTMSPLQPSTTSTVSGPTPPPWGDYSLNANIFNTSGTIITENVDNGTASFLLPEGTWFFKILDDDDIYFPFYTLVTVNSSITVDFKLEYKGNLSFDVLDRLSKAKLDSPTVSCWQDSQKLNITAKTDMCKALMYEYCLIENQNNVTRCDVNEIVADFDICMNGTWDGFKLPGFEIYQEKWEISKNGTVNSSLTLNQVPLRDYNCTGKEISGKYIQETIFRSLRNKSQSLKFFLRHSGIKARINLTDIKTGVPITQFKMTIQEKDFDTNKTKETIIDVVDAKQLIGLPVGPVNFTISAPNFNYTKELRNITPSTLVISLQGTLRKPMNLLLKDNLSGKPIQKMNWTLMQAGGIPTKDDSDTGRGFLSTIFPDKRSFFNLSKLSNGLMSAAGYSEIHDKNISIFSRGNVYIPLDTGKYVLQLYTRDINKTTKFTNGFYENDVYNTQNYFEDLHFFNIYKTGFGDYLENTTALKKRDNRADNGGVSKLLMREIALSVSVYDDDCFNYCREVERCDVKQCQSLDPDSVIVEVKCEKCDEIEEQFMEISPGRKNVIEQIGFPITKLNKYRVIASDWSITCKKKGNSMKDYLPPPTHIRSIRQNLFVPCLLHKKLDKTSLEGELDSFDPFIKIALGWDSPNLEVGNDFNLNVVVFNTTTNEPVCGTAPVDFRGSKCQLMTALEARQLRTRQLTLNLTKEMLKEDGMYEEGEEEEEYKVKLKGDKKMTDDNWSCEMFNIARVMRDRCCSTNPEQYERCVNHDAETHAHMVNKGQGLETLIISQDIPKDSIIMVYVSQPVILPKPRIHDSSIEISIQYKDKNEEKVELLTIPPRLIKENMTSHNILLMKCIHLSKDGSVKLSSPLNNWMQALRQYDFDLSAVFKDGTMVSQCSKCMTLFCRDNPNIADTFGEGLGASLSQKEKRMCCCCAATIEIDLKKKNKATAARFKCLYSVSEVEEFWDECPDLKTDRMRFNRMMGLDFLALMNYDDGGISNKPVTQASGLNRMEDDLVAQRTVLGDGLETTEDPDPLFIYEETTQDPDPLFIYEDEPVDVPVIQEERGNDYSADEEDDEVILPELTPAEKGMNEPLFMDDPGVNINGTPVKEGLENETNENGDGESSTPKSIAQDKKERKSHVIDSATVKVSLNNPTEKGSVVENMFSSQIISKNSKRFKEPEVGEGSIERAKESETLFKNENLDETPEAVKEENKFDPLSESYITSFAWEGNKFQKQRIPLSSQRMMKKHLNLPMKSIKDIKDYINVGEGRIDNSAIGLSNQIIDNSEEKLDGNQNVNIGPSDIDIGTRDLNQEVDSKQPMIQIDGSQVLDNSQDDLTNPDQLPIDDSINDPRKVDTRLLAMDNNLKDSAQEIHFDPILKKSERVKSFKTFDHGHQIQAREKNLDFKIPETPIDPSVLVNPESGVFDTDKQTSGLKFKPVVSILDKENPDSIEKNEVSLLTQNIRENEGSFPKNTKIKDSSFAQNNIENESLLTLNTLENEDLLSKITKKYEGPLTEDTIQDKAPLLANAVEDEASNAMEDEGLQKSDLYSDVRTSLIEDRPKNSRPTSRMKSKDSEESTLEPKSLNQIINDRLKNLEKEVNPIPTDMKHIPDEVPGSLFEKQTINRDTKNRRKLN